MQEVASSTCGASDQPSNPEEVAEPVLPDNQELDEGPDDFFAELGARRNVGDVVLDDTAMLCMSELNRYKLVPQIPPSRDPLKWWAENVLKFPILGTLALRYLSIPATSASLERLWSVASQIITKTRTQLKSHVVADLMFLKENGHILGKHAAPMEGRDRILPMVYPKDKDSTWHQRVDEEQEVLDVESD